MCTVESLQFLRTKNSPTVGVFNRQETPEKKIHGMENVHPSEDGTSQLIKLCRHLVFSTRIGCFRVFFQKGNCKMAKWPWFLPVSSTDPFQGQRMSREVTNLVTRHTAPPSDRTISPGSQVQQHSRESVTGLRCNLHHVVWCCGFLFEYLRLMLFECHRFSWIYIENLHFFQGSLGGPLTFPNEIGEAATAKYLTGSDGWQGRNPPIACMDLHPRMQSWHP